jgi:hypothetical protein
MATREPDRPLMSTLRVLLDAAPDANRADGRCLTTTIACTVGTRAGRVARGRPQDAVPAACVRIVSLHLPPLPADRVAAAAAFALEDQLAGPADEQHIAVSLQRSDGTVEAVVANRELIAALAANFDRILAEPALAPRPVARHWRWYASGFGGGFVRRPDGSAFATSGDSGIPAELNLALDHAERSGAGPTKVETAFATGEAMRSDSAQHVGTAFVPATAWRWDSAGGAAFTEATDLRQGEFARAKPSVEQGSMRPFRIAAIIAAAAIALHVAATIGDWASLRIADWRTRSAIASLASEMGITGTDDPAVAIARRHAQARHSAGFAAPADALPLLARAAPALAALPTGVMKTAAYSDGHWTFDLANPDVETTARLERQLASAGLTTLQATSASGTRLRVALATGAQ